MHSYPILLNNPIETGTEVGPLLNTQPAAAGEKVTKTTHSTPCTCT